jgi:UDP-glucose 4-epimerase
MVTNVQGTETVLEYCTKVRKRVLIASSSEVYGDHRDERPLREGDRRVYGPVTERRWSYAETKAMDEFLALGFHQERELDCVIARFFNTVGPRQQGQYGMVIPRFVGRALAGEPLEVHGDGTQTRSFCHVRDTIKAVHGLMEAREISGEIFNIGSAERLRIIDLANRVLELTGSASELEFVPHDEVYGVGIEDVLHREPSIEKIAAAIGWAPSHSLDDILADVIAFERGKVEAAA